MGSYQRFPKGGAAADAARRRSHEWLDEQFRRAAGLPRPAERIDTTGMVKRFDNLEIAKLLRSTPHPTRH